ncbi:MAG: CehA/McbA family metallohydrolase [Gammaproteobacteria bacterium]
MRTQLIGAPVRARPLALLATLIIALVPSAQVSAHGNEARLVEFLNWKKIEHVSRIFGANRAHLEGLPSTPKKPIIRVIEGDSCIVGDLIGFDVDDRYAFDIDEPVELTLTFAAQYTAPLVVGWDMSGGSGAGITPELTLDKSVTFKDITVKLDRARFAGQGTQGADIAIGAPGGMALCNIKVVRSNTTKAASSFGDVDITFKDAKTGGLVPARVGLYDATGRAPLANDKSLMLQRFADDLRMLAVNERTFWPSPNRQAFYVDGNYKARVPSGTYELVATRGPEFKAYREKIEVLEGKTTQHTVSMQRYADMPKDGWYSGDAHIHVTRDEVADQNIWGFVAAEDVHVGNLLEMGNIQNVYFKQPAAWGKASRFERDGHFLVSGQEAPRTRQFGHTIHFNLTAPVHLKTEDYFLYHRVFEEVQRQGGISGFAHMGWNGGDDPAGNDGKGAVNRGLTLLAPFGLVDFIEVLQGGRLVTGAWYRLLNLGYRITPAAGTDWPYTDFPGVVRNYVNVKGPFNLDGWFDSFNAGKTFVTNGPLLKLSINGKGMGEELKVKRGTKLDIVADAKLNPDVDTLDRLDLVVLGDVTDTQSAQGKDTVSMRKQIVADHSMWIAVRALGGRQSARNMTIAHTAPIYVVVEDEPTWKRAEVPDIIAELRDRLQRILTDPIDTPIMGNEPWETRLTLTDQWILQQPLLRPRVDAADALYAKVLDKWKTFTAADSAAPASAGAAR